MLDKMIGKVRNLLIAKDGPLTERLVLRPGAFGLGQVAGVKPAGTAKSICGFCSTGCSLNIHLDKEGAAIGLTPDSNYPVNLGMACPKGWEALTVLSSGDRATAPLLHGQEVSWDAALTELCAKFKGIQAKHGAESVAFLGTGQTTCEELAFFGSLAKFGMGMIHGDGNTRQCMATSVVAHKGCFGFDAPPYTYADFEESDVLVFIGANPCIAHPIMWQRVLRNKRKPTIIVVDPRKTETAVAATHHYALKPKGDLPLFYGLAHLLARDGKVDEAFIAAHTNHYPAFAEFIRDFTPATVAQASGLSEAQLAEFAGLIGDPAKRVSFWWTMGVNQGHEATRTAQAIIALALMTGNIGKPGTGANSITGQCNAMGSRLFSNTTGLLGAHDFTNPDHRTKVAAALEIPVEKIPARGSLAYDQIIQGIADDKIKGLWVVATNGAHSWTNRSEFAALMKKLDFLVVQDMYTTTETAQLAHLVLPAAGWGEKEGTFINSERRVGVVRQTRRAPGQALSDFRIFQAVAQYWGCADLFKKWESPEAVFQLLKACSKGQPCDITGIQDYAMLDESGGIQWPLPDGLPPQQQERRLFADGKFFTPDGRANFVFEAPRPAPEVADEAWPMVLLTGRGTSAQWHTQTRTGKSAVLRKLYPEAVYIEIHPQDAKRMGVADGMPVRVESRRGAAQAAAKVTTTVQPGQVFMPMHYPETNLLTLRTVDPHSRQPSYKACSVRVERA